MKNFKKVLAIFLAVFMILGSSVSIMAAFVTSGTFKSETRFFRYDGSDWVETTKVKPGETIKARLYFTTSYVAAEQFVLYLYNKNVITPDTSKHTIAEPGWYSLIPNPDETFDLGGVSYPRHSGTFKFDELDPDTDDYSEYGYLVDDWGINSSIFDDYGMLKIWADGGVTEQFDGSTWVYEFYFKVKDNAPADAAATMLLPVEGRYTTAIDGSFAYYTNVPQMSDTEVEGIEMSETNGTNKLSSYYFLFDVENTIPDGIDDLAESQGDSASDYSANTQFTYGGKSAVSSYVTLGGDVDVTFNVDGDDNYEEVVTLPFGSDIAGNEPAYTAPFGYDFAGWPVDGNNVTVDNDGNYQATEIVDGQEVTGTLEANPVTVNYYPPAAVYDPDLNTTSEMGSATMWQTAVMRKQGTKYYWDQDVPKSTEISYGEVPEWDASFGPLQDIADGYYFAGWAPFDPDAADPFDPEAASLGYMTAAPSVSDTVEGDGYDYSPSNGKTGTTGSSGNHNLYDTLIADPASAVMKAVTQANYGAYIIDDSGDLSLNLVAIIYKLPTQYYTVNWKYWEPDTTNEITLATETDVVEGTTVTPLSTETDPAVPAAEGYTFKWYTDAARETEAATADYTINADTTFYGKYTINTHTVTYNYKSGETDVLPGTQTDAEYNSVVDLTPPAVDGYFIPADSEPVIEPALLAGNKMPDSDVTVTFNYKANPKLSWLVNDEALKENQVAPKSTITDAMAPAATEIDAALDGTGKYFDGWSSYPATMPETDVSVEAVLKDEEYTFKFVDNQDYDVTNNTADTPVKATDTYSALPVPANVPEGYSFAGYQDVNDPTKVYDPANAGDTPFGDLGNNGDEITVKPLFTANDYSIVYYDSDNATALATVTEPYGTTITDPAVSVTAKEGYTFQNSWTYKTDAGVDCDPQPTTFPAENLKAYPDFEINTYKYIFVDEKFGTTTADIEAEYNDDIATPTDPSYEGWTFAGWYSDQTLENKYTFPAKMPALGDGSDGQTMTLYAKWNPVLVDINITFDADGGTFTDGNTGTYTATAGATWTDAVPTYNVVNYAAEGLSKPGYALTGWKVNGGSTITAFPSVYPDADTTYTAVWRARSVTVKYLVAPDATSLDDIDFSDNAALDAMTVRSAGVPYGTTGYQIISYTGDDGAVEKWTVKVDGAPAEYAPLSTVDIVAPLVTLNASGIPETLYFVALSVNPEMYNITFDANGGYFDGDENKVTKIATVSDGETPTCNDPVWPGHTFIDWDPAVVPATGDTTYKALWETKEYTIIYKNNYDETDDSDYESATVTDPIELPQDPDREGYEFLGWFTDRDGTAGNEFDEDYALPDDNTAPIEVYAKWEIQKYEITYDANGGEFVGTPTNPVAATFGDALPTEPEVTREGYTPDGWVYKDADAATYTDATMPAEDLTATVQWKLKTFTVTFDPDNGDPEIEMPDQPYGEDIAVPRSPSKEGYDFDKWVDADGKTPEDYNNDAGMPDVEDLSFTATYIAKEYPVKFIDDGNTVAEEDRAFGEKFDDLAPTYTPEKTGYTFGGWNTADDGTGTAYDSSLTVPVGGYTFYAVY
ncbi:MAG: InlB B-repeat-containing protein, partial [Clostridia bacterium]|nr:InlB B-repeat-containing protein [Clostridia bacterium]